MRRPALSNFLLAGTMLVALAGAGLGQAGPGADPATAAPMARLEEGDGAGAIVLLTAAAEAGDPEALAQVAQILLEGKGGLSPDPAAARVWAGKASDAGVARGDLILGQNWMKGLGVTADPDKALEFFSRAEAKGDMKAGRYIGLIARDKGDLATAAQWFMSAATKGDITSQFLLGQAYETGAGVPQDEVAAMAWYQKSAARGDLIASDGMVGMAGLYETGRGVAADPVKAKALYQQAADLGNTAAAEALRRLSGP